MSRYLKSLTALCTGVIGWAAFVVASAPAEITAPEWIMLAVAVGTALGVYGVPNAPKPSSLPPAFVYQPIVGTSNPAAVTVKWDEPPAKKPPPVKPVKKVAKKAKP